MDVPAWMINSGYFLAKQLNPLEAIYKNSKDDRRRLHVDHNGETVIDYIPHDTHRYFVKIAYPEMRGAVVEKLRDLGVSPQWSTKTPQVLECSYVIFPKNYALDGDRTRPLWEDELEAVPGVSKVIYTGMHSSGQTRYVYKNGELLYDEEWYSQL